MEIFKDFDLLSRLNRLIRIKATGTPCALGKLLGFSERQTRRIIKDLKKEGLPIVYDKERKSYKYTKEVFMKFEISIIEGKEKTQILGGEKKDFDFFKFFSQTDIF